MSKDDECLRGQKPLVWYMAAGYGLPAGIEAHILHYATELRNHGFETRVVVFKELPEVPHRFLTALADRKIPIVSLQSLARENARTRMAALLPLWFLYTAAVKRRRPNPRNYRFWALGQQAMRELDRLRAIERPDIVHIFGRLPTAAWERLPAERTLFHEMMTGTVDRHWTESELADFRGFAERAARYFAPGTGVAENVRREFGVRRRIDPIFTMCPDEAGDEKPGVRCKVLEKIESLLPGSTNADGLQSPSRPLRFGVIFRLTGQKGIVFLLEALKAYRTRHGSVDFTFGGVGPMETTIREFAVSNHLPDVRVVRVQSASAILRNIDVFVHPSVDDAMPVSIAEALMCGVPCIVCRVGGCADLVRDGVEGFVIEPRDAVAIQDRMERLAAMPKAEFEAFACRARARYEEVCRPASVGAVVAQHYRDIIESVGRIGSVGEE